MNGKYFKYAIGEIFLVVVGILIAISISDFRQSLKNENIRKRLAASLHQEFMANRDQILLVKNNQENAIYSAFNLIGLMNEYDESNPDSLRKWTAVLGNIWTFNPQNGVLKNAIASGDILLFESDSLKNILFGWEGLTLDINEEQERLFQNFDRVLVVLDKHIQAVSSMDYYADKFEASAFSSDYKSLLSDPQFENALAFHATLFMDHTEELETLKARNELILALLEKE